MRAHPHRFVRLAALLALVAATPAAAQIVRVSPSSTTLPIRATRQLTAYVNGLPSTRVAWSVNGVAGGDATVGTIDRSGRYTAPAVPPAGWTVTARASALGNPNASAACAITVRHPTPVLSAVSPGAVSVGAFTLEVRGSAFVDGARVLWNGTPLSTTFASDGLLRATGTAAVAGTARVTVANPGPGAVSLPLYLTVRTAPTRTPTAKPPTPRPTETRTATLPPTATATTVPATMVPTATSTMRPTETRTAVAPTMTATRMASETRTPVPAATIPARTEPSRTIPPTATATGTALVPVQDPLAITYGRFLDQATFGPTQALTAHIAQVGIPGFLAEQFAAPESPWPPLTTPQRSDVVDAFFNNALSGQDQLRQRVIFALSEIVVEAFNKNTNPEDMIPWLQLLSRNAFGNYRTLLREISIDGSMGKYLDLANSGFFGGAPNENYPREVMQLFSIGLYQLNLDGSVQRDANGAPIPTYAQADVRELARALTGWTYGNASGTPPTYANSNYYPGPMLPVETYHDHTAKTVLGRALPANQTAVQDLDAAIDIIFQHPNVGPFLALRLIRALVTSNPSPAYVARVAAAFNGNGARGDMQAVLRAVLLDPEARNDTPPATFGRLRTPMQHTIALARALGLNLGQPSQFAYLFTDMNESLLDAPSVFGHYSPMYRQPVTGLFGPEFQIYSASDAVNRANLFYLFMFSPWPINPALQPFVAVAGTPTALVNAVDQALLYGRMLPATRAALLAAMPAMPDNNARALTAVYLTSMAGEYLVQR